MKKTKLMLDEHVVPTPVVDENCPIEVVDEYVYLRRNLKKSVNRNSNRQATLPVELAIAIDERFSSGDQKLDVVACDQLLLAELTTESRLEGIVGCMWPKTVRRRHLEGRNISNSGSPTAGKVTVTPDKGTGSGDGIGKRHKHPIAKQNVLAVFELEMQFDHNRLARNEPGTTRLEVNSLNRRAATAPHSYPFSGHRVGVTRHSSNVTFHTKPLNR
ncbi:hypothetical protein EVAR_4627_1 [Eumeta japonica]|uniref:Uncharacterized protein n=1 Tax=Eumeta variegata TaxID=151549 RepID=A0A4C1SZ20_EUMVA|nr:hypothetical protein EVAR_4627_1 [Eumeta japonica]